MRDVAGVCSRIASWVVWRMLQERPPGPALDLHKLRVYSTAFDAIIEALPFAATVGDGYPSGCQACPARWHHCRVYFHLHCPCECAPPTNVTATFCVTRHSCLPTSRAPSTAACSSSPTAPPTRHGTRMVGMVVARRQATTVATTTVTRPSLVTRMTLPVERVLTGSWATVQVWKAVGQWMPQHRCSA